LFRARIDGDAPADDGTLFLPIIINKNLLYGVVDSGSRRSILNSSWCDSLNLHRSLPKVKIKFIDKRELTLSTTIATIENPKNNNKFSHEFLVSEMDDDVIIGLDLFSSLGVQMLLPLLKTDASVKSLELKCSEDYDKPSLIEGNKKEESFLKNSSIIEQLKQNEEIGNDAPSKLSPLRIYLNDDTPICLKQYGIAKSLYKPLDECITNWLSSKKIAIAPPNTKFNFPLVIAFKYKDGKKTGIRVCLDTRKLNERIRMDSFPLPEIKFLLRRLAGSKFFSEIDLREAFLQMAVLEEHQSRLAFTIPYQQKETQFIFRRAPFGLKNIPGFFQREMSTALRDLQCCVVYLDNVVIFSSTLEQHIIDVHAVLKRLNEFQLKINPEKCKFAYQEIKILGHVITSQGVSVDERRIRQLLDFPLPSSMKQLESFIGLYTFIRPFIPKATEVIYELDKIKSSFAEYVNDEEKKKHFGDCFAKAKSQIQQTIVLRFPDSSKTTRLLVMPQQTALVQYSFKNLKFLHQQP